MSTRTTKYRAPVLTLTIAAAIAAALPAHAAEKRASRQENIGVVSGLAVGALAGGPVGAIIGAATGAVLGDKYHRESQKNEALSANLDQSKKDTTKLAEKYDELTGTLMDSETRRHQMTQTVESTKDLETDVKFRTASADLTPQELSKLYKLGALAKTLPGTTVRISGYADPRGPKLFNENLSDARAETVAAALIEAGIPTDRMIVEAMGEESSTSPDGDLDAYAFDRRVTVRIEHPEGSKVASAK